MAVSVPIRFDQYRTLERRAGGHEPNPLGRSGSVMDPLLGAHEANVEGDALRRLAERVCFLAGVDRAYLIRVHDNVLDCEFEYCING